MHRFAAAVDVQVCPDRFQMEELFGVRSVDHHGEAELASVVQADAITEARFDHHVQLRLHVVRPYADGATAKTTFVAYAGAASAHVLPLRAYQRSAALADIIGIEDALDVELVVRVPGSPDVADADVSVGGSDAHGLLVVGLDDQRLKVGGAQEAGCRSVGVAGDEPGHGSIPFSDRAAFDLLDVGFSGLDGGVPFLVGNCSVVLGGLLFCQQLFQRLYSTADPQHSLV